MSLEEEEQNLKLELVGKCFKVINPFKPVVGTYQKEGDLIFICSFTKKEIQVDYLSSFQLVEGIEFLSKGNLNFMFINNERYWSLERVLNLLEEVK